MKKEYTTAMVILVILALAIVGLISLVNSAYDYFEHVFYDVDPKGCEVSFGYGHEKHVIVGVKQE
jgi:hypothetical protein